MTRIVQTLQERVDSGFYAPTAALPPERVLAEELHVSRVTLRAALQTLAESGVLHRAHLRWVVTNQRPSRLAATTIGFWCVHGADALISGILSAGIQRALDPVRHHLVVANAPFSALVSSEKLLKTEREWIDLVASDPNIAGVIFWYSGRPENVPALHALQQTGKPMVFLDRMPPDDIQADFVGVDNQEAAYQVVAHLIAQGHRRIAHVTSSDQVSTVYERLTGYRRALAETGLPDDPALILPDAFHVDRDFAEGFVAMPDRPTAIFCVHDYSAHNVIKTLRELEVRVPEEIAVAGFDGWEETTGQPPTLTTACQPIRRIGEAAARLILHRLESLPDPYQTRLLLEAPLRIHASTQHRVY